MAYLITFSLAGCLGFLASKCNGRMKMAVAFVAVMPLAALAGMRSATVGTDVNVYAVPIFDAALGSSLPEFMQSHLGGLTEPLFSVYTWLIANTFHDLGWYLFFLQLAVVLPVVLVLVKLAPRYIGAGLVVYSCVSFGFSLNIMRQSIAASFLLLAFFALLHNRRITYLFWIVVASGFHTTGFLGLAFIPLLFLTKHHSGEGGRGVSTRSFGQLLVAVAAFAAVLATFVYGSSLLNQLGGFRASYANQIRDAGEGGFNETAIVFVVFATLVYVIASRTLLHDTSLKSLFAIVVLGGIGAQYSIVSPELGRVGLMFFVFAAVFYAVALKSVERHKNRRTAVYLILLLASIFFFVWVYVNGGSGEIYPYIPALLDSR